MDVRPYLVQESDGIGLVEDVDVVHYPKREQHLRTTTLGELKFTQEALDNARSRATPEAAPHLEGLSLDTTIGQLPYFKGKGCDACAGTGLKGRQGLYEVMFMTPRLRRLILQNVGAAEIRDGAIEEGMLTLRMDGMKKIERGVTTLEEVVKETAE